MAKRLLNLRTEQAAFDWIEQVAKDTGANTAQVARAMLSVATSHKAEVVSRVRAVLLAEGKVVGRG